MTGVNLVRGFESLPLRRPVFSDDGAGVGDGRCPPGFCSDSRSRARSAACTAPVAAQAAQAPGAPGERHTWAPADKHGFGTATRPSSNVWFTLRAAELTEIYYPDLSTPSFRDLEFAVTDGKTFLDRETDPRRPVGGAAAARVARPSGRRRRPRAGASSRPGSPIPSARPCCEGALRVADRPAAAAVRAGRPGARRRRQRRPRPRRGVGAAGLGRRGGQRRDRRARACAARRAATPARRAIPGATSQRTWRSTVATAPSRRATSCRRRARG